MSQVTDRTVGANPSGFDMRTELNNIIAALESDNSGSSEPLNPVPYMKWLDTSNATYYYYKERNHDNTAWVTLFRYTVATKVMEAVSNGTDLTTILALKANLASPTFTGTVVLPSTTSIGTITNTELSYIDGVTSNIQTQFSGKQDTLVSGTNIKTINSNSILGSGDLVVSAPSASQTAQGIIEIATDAEVQAGTDTTRAVTPAGMKAGLGNLNATLTSGGVGTYAFLGKTVAGITAVGATVAGSSLRYAGIDCNNAWSAADLNPSRFSGSATSPSGTWMCMGTAGSLGTTYGASLWLRIA